MMMESKTSNNFREDFPGYQGHVPYKFGIIGKTVGATNESIKELLATEPPKETLLFQGERDDYSYYDRDYYCDNFYRGYPLEEDKIFSNTSKNAKTWIVGDKYKIYPQHIPGVKCHVPGIYSSNIYGMGYSKSTAVAIKGNYNKTQDCSNKERFTSTNMEYYKKPKVRSNEEEKQMSKTAGYFNQMNYNYLNNANKFKRDVRAIYKSKIAQVPTPGYAGHTSVFHKPISYLNYDKIMESEKLEKLPVYDIGEGLPDKFRDALYIKRPDLDLPYVVGYKGFRVGVKARNYHGENFHDTSLKARNEAKFLKKD